MLVAPYYIVRSCEQEKRSLRLGMQQNMATIQSKASRFLPGRRSKTSGEPTQKWQVTWRSSSWQAVVACPDAGGDVAAKASGGGGGGPEVETVPCACCGVAEECTAAYVSGVRAAFCGDWLCGLCGEAVKERMVRDPTGGVEVALVSHEAECRDFNATTRLNPTLSLAGSMRGIARKSFDRRKTTTSSASCQDRHLRTAASRAVVLASSVSCDPRFLGEAINNGSAGDRCR